MVLEQGLGARQKEVSPPQKNGSVKNGRYGMEQHRTRCSRIPKRR